MLRSVCNRSLSSYLLSSLSVTVPVRYYGRYGRGDDKDKKQEKPSPFTNRDYTKAIKKDYKQESVNDRKERKKPTKPSNPFLRAKPVYSGKKKKKEGSMPEPYKYTMFAKNWKERDTKKLLKHEAIAAHRKARDEFKQQKKAIFTSQTLPAVMKPQQIAELITVQKKITKSLDVFKEARTAGLATGPVYAALVEKLCSFEQPLHALNMIEEIESHSGYSDLPSRAFVDALGAERAGDFVLAARKMMISENILPVNSTYPVTFSPNDYLAMLGHSGRPWDALEMVQEMSGSNVKLDQHSYQSLCLMFHQLKLFEKVKDTLSKMALNHQITIDMLNKLQHMQQNNDNNNENEDNNENDENDNTRESDEQEGEDVAAQQDYISKDNNTSNNNTQTDNKNNNNNTTNNNKQGPIKYQPFMQLHNRDVKKLLLKHSLKETDHEILKVV